MPRKMSFDEASSRLWIEDLGAIILAGRRARLVAMLVRQITPEEPYQLKNYQVLIEYVYFDEVDRSDLNPTHIQGLLDNIREDMVTEFQLDRRGEEAVFWRNQRSLGYHVDRERFTVVPPAVPPPPIWPPEKDKPKVNQWKNRFENNEDETRREIEGIAQNLIHNRIPPEQRRETFQELLLGSTALIELKAIIYPQVIKAVTIYVQRLQLDDTATHALSLVNPFTAWLHDRACQTQSQHLYHALYELCHAAWEHFKRNNDDIDESVMFHRVFSVAAFLNNFDRLEEQEIIKLEAWLKQTLLGFGDLRRLEYYSLYLEVFSDIWRRRQNQEKVNLVLMEAGVESMEAANLAEGIGRFQFAAGLYIRAAECFKQIDKSNTAAMALLAAANLMTRNRRMSKQAVIHYREWIRLIPENPDNHQLTLVQQRIKSLGDELKEREHRPKVAVLVNLFDIDFADALVAPFLELGEGFNCEFGAPDKVADLADLTNYAGIILVGGIQAQGMYEHLKKYFYRVTPTRCYGPWPGQMHRTFEELDQRLSHYCCVFRGSVKNKPAIVLAGLTRYETCQAIVNFCSEESSDLFQQFVNGIQG